MEWIGIVGAVLGVLISIGAVVAIVAAVVAKYRTDADERSLAIWKGEAEAQKARADRLELQVADLIRRVEFLESEHMARFQETISTALRALPCALVQIPRKDPSNE